MVPLSGPVTAFVLWQAARVRVTGRSATPSADRLLFVGMMGAGKSTVARLLAARQGWGFVDTDEVVERANAMTVAEMFSLRGEAAFRAAESETLAGLRDIDGPLVASVGGGAVMNGANRGAMRAIGTVVWLRARPETLAHRVGQGEDRPLLRTSSIGPRQALERLAAEREPLYGAVADVVVDVDDVSAEEAVDLVMAKLAELVGGTG